MEPTKNIELPQNSEQIPPVDSANPVTSQSVTDTNSRSPKKRKIIVITLISFLIFSLIGYAAYIFLTKKTYEPLPYETIVAAANPREKFEQTITGNPVFTQIKTSSAPIAPVDDDHNQGSQTMLSLKAALGSEGIEQDSQKQKTLIKLDGTMFEPTSGASQDFKLKASLLRLIQGGGNKSMMDLIINGSVGDAKLDDENQDAIHISLTQTDPNNSYLKVNMSDYLLIFINRIMNPEPQNTTSISFETNDIWPFLGQYLHIPRSIEEIRFGNALSQEDKNRLETVRAESAVVFQNTLGNINSYIEISELSQETGSTIFTGTIVPEKLATTISNYFLGIQDLQNRHLEDLQILCVSTSTSPEESEECQSTFSRPQEEEVDVNQLTNFLNYFQFEPIKATIDDQSLVVNSLSFGLSFNSQDNVNESLAPLPFSKFSLRVESNLVDSTIETIKAPQKFVELLAAGDNSEAFSDNSYEDESVQGTLYRENKQLLLTGYSDIKRVCSGPSEKEYCLNVPEIWRDFSSNEDGFNFLSLTRKNLNPLDRTNTNLTIRQDVQYISTCSYSDSKSASGMQMEKYKEVTTVDGVNLRISEPKKYPDSYDDYNYLYVCSIKDGVYFETTPYGNISIDAGSSSFEDILTEVEPILSSLSFNDVVSLSRFSYPTVKPIQTPFYDLSTPTKVYESNGHTFVMFYGSSPGDDGSCSTLSSFLSEKYDVNESSAFTVPSGYGVCVKANGCAICQNGKLSAPTSDLSKCSGQICQ